MKNHEAIHKAQASANSPKEQLMKLANDLHEAGEHRKASSLETIIIKLECWQNSI